MTVAFKAKVENDAIQIPDAYKYLFANGTFAMVAPVTSEDIRNDLIAQGRYVPARNKGLQISPPHIDTSVWKFNREEANER